MAVNEDDSCEVILDYDSLPQNIEVEEEEFKEL